MRSVKNPARSRPLSRNVRRLMKMARESPANPEVEKMAFSHCDSLTTITIPASVVEIGMLVFRDCKNLKDVRVAPSSYAEQYCIENKIPYSFVND